MSPSLVSTARTGMRAAPYAALEKACALAHASDPTAAHDLVAAHHANLLAVVGRLDDAAAQVADGIEQARRERNAMALDIWADIDGWVHLAAGRLSAARAAVESSPRPHANRCDRPGRDPHGASGRSGGAHR